jgi:hypothetical protein
MYAVIGLLADRGRHRRWQHLRHRWCGLRGWRRV